MKKFMLLPVLGLLAAIPSDTSGFPRGGGGGGRGGGGGGGARPNVSRPSTPSFSGGGARPNVSRPSTPNVSRPAFAPQNRPATTPSRPNIGGGGGGVQRPSTLPANRPNIGGGGGVQRPSTLPANRPNIGGGGGIQRPSTLPANRPNIGGGGNIINNRPGGGNIINNHPGIGIGNRPNIGSGGNINVNRPVNINNAVNRGVIAARPAGGYYRPGYAHYHGYCDHWHHGYWNNYRPWLWGTAGLATGLIFGGGSAPVYSNPYYDSSASTVVYDYSQPIPVPEATTYEEPPAYAADQSAPAAAPPSEPVDEKAVAANKLLDEARDAFMKKDYASAQTAIDKAIGVLPNDATLHEFRGLVLFARQKYPEAAATIYAVLAVGPGWDWDTLKSLYPDTATYTAQLRDLEKYANANPMDASSRFLLGYHYLILDSKNDALRMFKRCVELQPKDELAAHLVKMLDPQPTADRPAPLK